MALLLAALLVSPEAQQSAVETWCARQPLQVVERRLECNPVKAERIADVSRFLREVEWDREASLAEAVSPFAASDSSDPFEE